MVNKAVLGVLGAIVVVSLGVGTLVGLQLGGGGPAEDGGGVGDGADGSAGGGEGTDAATVSPPASTETRVASDPTATPTASSATPSAQTTIPPRRFEDELVADNVVEAVNAERTEAGLDPFADTGNTAGRVSAMAANHSVAMADAGRVAQEIDGVATHHRYRSAGLADRCTFADAGGQQVWDPSYGHLADDLEVVGRTVAGQPYEVEGETRFNGDEAAVAGAVVESWFADETYEERLLREGPTVLGVGVEITREGTVYVTANVCA